TCGARAGEQSPQLRELLAKLPGEDAEAAPSDAQAPAQAAREEQRLRLPGPRISAVLVAVFVGFGALIGTAAGSSSPAREVHVVASPTQQAGTDAGAETGSGSGEGSSGSEEEESEAPETEEESTPSPAAAQSSGGGGQSGAEATPQKAASKPSEGAQS